MLLENQSIEYKREYTDETKKTVRAFANTVGGKIYIGINDDLSIVGLNDTDKVLLKCTTMIRDSIKPDITTFIDYKVEISEGKSIVVLEVQNYQQSHRVFLEIFIMNYANKNKNSIFRHQILYHRKQKTCCTIAYSYG